MEPAAPSSPDRLAQQLTFLREIDKLKQVLRRCLVSGSERREDSAEHSWHLALMTLVLSEHAGGSSVDQLRVIKLVLIHDIVEIDAGDTFCYDVSAHKDKAEREQAAAQRIFTLLPPDQATKMRELWNEFEAGLTREAKVAQALDRLQPILQNLQTQGASWKEHHVTKAAVLERNQKIGECLPAIWSVVQTQLEEAERAGYFASS